jgi:GNAT superfamily N-acetyltransferase
LSGFEVSTERARLDVELVHRFLSTSSYWAQGRSLEDVARSLEHSLCFGVYTTPASDAPQIGFGRVVTDYTVFGYVADVFVLPEWRGKGVGTQLLRAIVEHPQLSRLGGMMLRTKDAHAFYEAFGFVSPPRMEELLARYPEPPREL